MNGVLRRLALALLALALGLGASTAVAATIFRDAAGDVKGGAGPDLTSLSVSHTATAVTFRLRFAQAPPLGVSAEGWVDMLLVGIDTPPRSLSRTPRGWYGLDYYAGLHGAEQTAVLVRSAVTKPGSTCDMPVISTDIRLAKLAILTRTVMEIFPLEQDLMMLQVWMQDVHSFILALQ